ncbi:MAG: hypothetical protein R3A11_04730 [Bdellovibrionota bacterium]
MNDISNHVEYVRVTPAEKIQVRQHYDAWRNYLTNHSGWNIDGDRSWKVCYDSDRDGCYGIVFVKK